MNKSVNVFCAGAALFGLGGSAWAAQTPPAGAPDMHHAATAEGAKLAQDANRAYGVSGRRSFGASPEDMLFSAHYPGH
jgi:hypothetical protein